MRRLPLLVLALTVPLLAACGDDPERIRDDAGRNADKEGGQASTELVLNRADGSTHLFPEPWAACRESEYEPGEQVLVVFAGDLKKKRPTFLMLDLGADGVGPTTLELPTPGTEDTDSVFVADGRDELSGAQEGATGTVEVTEASCEVGQPVRLSLDVHLTSEFHGGGEVDVRGDIDVELGEMGGELSEAG